jgi:signal transduction histidine kinase
MKLLTKTSLFYLISFSIILVLGGFSFYKGLNIILYKQIDDGLITEKSIIEEEISHNDSIPDFTSNFSNEIEVFRYTYAIEPSYKLEDTTIFDKEQSSEMVYRHLLIKGNISGKGFSISLMHPLTETHLIIKNIVNTLLIMMFFVFISLILFNFLISKNVWKPFYSTISKLLQYDIKSRQNLNLPASNIDEFDTLNKVLANMANKIQADYLNLKEFTENASHEIQTPLAIIKSEMEMLIQSENLTDQQARSVNIINHTVARLSKLNSGLLLISKIENDQYFETEQIFVNTLIENSLDTYNDFIIHKNITVQLIFEEKLYVVMNPILADILVNNLINNAIKHNMDKGFIKIFVDEKGFSLENSGLKLDDNVNTSDLFNRFKKRSSFENSVGLGLAIVKKICDTYHFSVTYKYLECTHKIILSLSSDDR